MRKLYFKHLLLVTTGFFLTTLAVSSAYGVPADQDVTEFLLDLNQCLADDETQRRDVQGPGLPNGLDAGDSRWASNDCIQPPAVS